MGIRDVVAKAKEKLRGERTEVEEGVERTGDKFDNATGNRFTAQTGRGRESVNERLDDFLGGDDPTRTRDSRGF